MPACVLVQQAQTTHISTIYKTTTTKSCVCVVCTKQGRIFLSTAKNRKSHTHILYARKLRISLHAGGIYLFSEQGNIVFDRAYMVVCLCALLRFAVCTSNNMCTEHNTHTQHAIIGRRPYIDRKDNAYTTHIQQNRIKMVLHFTCTRNYVRSAMKLFALG